MASPYSLLLVDDDVELLRILARWFQRRGYNVTAVDNPSDAECALRQGDFQAAVIDCWLPERTGLDLMQSLHQVAPELQVILLSGHTDQEAKGSALTRGAYAYLFKPCRLDELESVTRRACDCREPTTAAG